MGITSADAGSHGVRNIGEEMKHDHVLSLTLFHYVDSPMFGEFRTLFQGSPAEVRIWLGGYPADDLYVYEAETGGILPAKKYLELSSDKS